MNQNISKEEARKILKQLHDKPARTEDAPDSVLTPIYKYLIKEQALVDGELHWFCPRADEVIAEAATFLLRLHAYSRVDEWRKWLWTCLSGCCNCVRAFNETMVSSRETYFGAFETNVQDAFFEGLRSWVTDMIIESLQKTPLMAVDKPTNSSISLCDVPPAIVYSMVIDLRTLSNPRIIGVIHDYPPRSSIHDWPVNLPPVGLFLLLMDEHIDVRTWAQQQIAIYKTTPLPLAQFSSMYVTALDDATNQVMTSGGSSFSTSTSEVAHSSFPFVQDPGPLWQGYCTFLRFVPVELLNSNRLCRSDIRHVVVGHLHDTGNHFMEVLKCFLLVLTRIGPDMWRDESAQYPDVIFSAVKDNPRYVDTLQRINGSGKEVWPIHWLETYIKSVGNMPAFKDIFPMIFQFLCEELQHERFEEVRPIALNVATKLISAVLTHPTHHDVVSAVLDIHGPLFVSVAFEKIYANEKWAETRASARRLVKDILERDIKDLHEAIVKLSLHHQATSLHFQDQMWLKMYEGLDPHDSEGVAIIVDIVSKIAHMDELREEAYGAAIQKAKDPTAAQATLVHINRTLLTFRSGFSDAVTRYIDLSAATTVGQLVRNSDVIKNVTILMFSPVQNIQETSQSLVGAAFDVEVRLDCFRALLEKYPDASMKGIFNFLSIFVAYAQNVMEACSLSKALARCITDIIDVMCSSPDGLLLDEKYLASMGGPKLAVQLPIWWKKMTAALTIIFLKTPKWAPYFEPEEMITWMRDALIFGRDMLAQWRVIEAGALASSKQSFSAGPTGTRKMSSIGRGMISALQPVLMDLTRWLRLTDEELLHQSFSLLESLLECFRTTQIPPQPSALEKLQKHVDDARNGDARRPQTRLDSTRLARLQDAISSFDEEEEIQIISHKLPTAKPTKPSAPAKETKPVQDSVRKSSLAVIQTKNYPSDRRTSSKSKSSGSKYFTANDQKKLDSATSMPTFRVSKTAASSSNPPQPKLSTATLTDGTVSITGSVAGTSSGSEDDNSEEEDGDVKGLASLVKMQITPKVKKPVERRQVKMLDVPVNGRNPALDRINKREDARRTALRLKPDITSLHRILLSWNYEHKGADPPGDRLMLTRVPDRFTDPDHYRRVFEPLLLQECWAQLQQSKEEVQEIYECRVNARQFIDDWVDLDISISSNVKKDWSISETDIVLLRHATNDKCILGKGKSYRASTYGVQATIRCYTRNVDPGLQSGTTWRLSRVFSLSTLHREYASLIAFPYYDLCQTILQPHLNQVVPPSRRELQQTMSSYSVNEPQAKAIVNALKTDGFVLIQGPPGTGKTSTICGLVHAFISQRPRPTTAIHAGRHAGPTDKEPCKKILLCAPSNAAIDEIAFRLKEGVSGSGQRATPPNVVRIGAIKSMNNSVKDVSLDYLIDRKLDTDASLQHSNIGKDTGDEISRIRAELEAVKRLRQQKFDEIKNVHDNTAKTLALEEEIKKLNKQKGVLTHQFDQLKDQQKSDHRTLDATRRKFRTEVLHNADVICSTLSGAAYEFLEQFDFELVIIDEAAQAIELSSLIPLKYRCNRCVMVGDPQQLPPTVISQEACKFLYNQSLFVRLQKQRPEAVHLLSIQYRMHPDISRLPSTLFYEGRLRDGPNVTTATIKPWHSHAKFGTYRFFNVTSGREESGSSHSLINRVECQVALALYIKLKGEYPSFDFNMKIGIVTMYRAQILELRRAFQNRFGADILRTVDFNTVDGFQGQEKDVVILSCVRAGPGLQNVGFLSDVRRMNVALTRAKSSLFILGNASTLERSDNVWRSIVTDARSRSALVDADPSYFTFSTPASTKNPSAKNSSAPTKLSSKRSHIVPDTAIPADLTTPRDFKFTVPKRTVSSESPVMMYDNPTAGQDIVNVQIGSAITSSEDRDQVSAGQKRHPLDDGPSRPPPALRLPQVNDGEKPRKPRPLVRRPKPPPSIFIPKKK